MDWKAKILIILGVVLVIVSLGFIIKYQRDIINKQSIIESSLVEQKELANGILRSQGSYILKKDLDNYAKSQNLDLKPIKEDLEKIKSEIKGINTIRVITNGVKSDNLPSDSVIKIPNNVTITEDKFNYLKTTQIKDINEISSEQKIPFGKVAFSAWKEKPWSEELYKREYFVTNTISIDEDGRSNVYNKFSVKVDDKFYDLKINKADYVDVFPEAKFRFSPRLYAGFNGGAYLNQIAGEASPNLKLYLFSSGKTKVDPNWIFLGLGGGYGVVGQSFLFNISPVGYNVGHHLPFVNNIFVEPSFAIDINGNYAVLAGLAFGL